LRLCSSARRLIVFDLIDTILSMLQIPNGVGVVFGVAQLALHAIYGHKKAPVDIEVIVEIHLNPGRSFYYRYVSALALHLSLSNTNARRGRLGKG
jgi:hypothetical protein